MNQDFKCFIKLHKFEVYKEEELKNIKGDVIGKVIISRCSNCGKIKIDKVITGLEYR